MADEITDNWLWDDLRYRGLRMLLLQDELPPLVAARPGGVQYEINDGTFHHVVNAVGTIRDHVCASGESFVVPPFPISNRMSDGGLVSWEDRLLVHLIERAVPTERCFSVFDLTPHTMSSLFEVAEDRDLVVAFVLCHPTMFRILAEFPRTMVDAGDYGFQSHIGPNRRRIFNGRIGKIRLMRGGTSATRTGHLMWTSEIVTSDLVSPNRLYLMPDSEYLGVIPQFMLPRATKIADVDDWICDETIGMAIMGGASMVRANVLDRSIL